MNTISVSILNSDLAHLAEVADTVLQSGADMLHYDVMDGCFVENLSFGLPVLAAIRECTPQTIDVHLMIQHPLRYIPQFIKAGADLISFHIESSSDPAKTIRAIHDGGIRAGVALSPETPAETVCPLLPLLRPDDFILLMTVRPGLGGQDFMPQVLPKIRTVREKLTAESLPLHIEVDGGINAETGRLCAEAGADMLVSGSYILRSRSPRQAVSSLRF